jgi:hypothetical protein
VYLDLFSFCGLHPRASTKSLPQFFRQPCLAFDAKETFCRLVTLSKIVTHD